MGRFSRDPSRSLGRDILQLDGTNRTSRMLAFLVFRGKWQVLPDVERGEVSSFLRRSLLSLEQTEEFPRGLEER